MFAVFGAINPSLKRINAPRKRFSTKTFPNPKSLNPSFFNVLRITRTLIGLGRTIGTIGTIEEAVAIMAYKA